MRLWILALVFCVRCAPTQPGPPVQNLKVSPLSPWAIFVTWKQPDNVRKDEINQYKLTGSISETRRPGDLWVFCFVDSGLIPGAAIEVTMTVEYKSLPHSLPETIRKTMPSARKPNLLLFFRKFVFFLFYFFF